MFTFWLVRGKGGAQFQVSFVSRAMTLVCISVLVRGNRRRRKRKFGERRWEATEEEERGKLGKEERRRKDGVARKQLKCE